MGHSDRVKMKMVLIPAGEFMMGSHESAEALAKALDTRNEERNGNEKGGTKKGTKKVSEPNGT